MKKKIIIILAMILFTLAFLFIYPFHLFFLPSETTHLEIRPMVYGLLSSEGMERARRGEFWPSMDGASVEAPYAILIFLKGLKEPWTLSKWF